jgi:hypothetical protein
MRAFVKPAEGRTVRRPETPGLVASPPGGKGRGMVRPQHAALPAEGAWVSLVDHGGYWQRRLNQGDVIDCTKAQTAIEVAAAKVAAETAAKQDAEEAAAAKDAAEKLAAAQAAEKEAQAEVAAHPEPATTEAQP